MSARERFVAEMELLAGKPVLWRMKGPDAFDCSGSITYSFKRAGGADLTLTDNAQALSNKTRLLVFGELPLAGDLCFYGFAPDSIEHVAMYRANGGIISADGATSHIDPQVLGYEKALALAMANPANRVRLHDSINYRKDTPYRVIHRNLLVDALDGVER